MRETEKEERKKGELSRFSPQGWRARPQRRRRGATGPTHPIRSLFLFDLDGQFFSFFK